MPSLRSGAPKRDPRRRPSRPRTRKCPCPDCRLGHRHHRVVLRHARVGDPALASVQHPAVAVAHRPRLHAAGVGAGLRLGQRVGEHRVAPGDRGQVLAASAPRRAGQEDRQVVPSLFTAGISEDDAHARATSSTTMQCASASAPAPPYASGNVVRCMSGLRQRLVHVPRVRRPAASISAAHGAMSRVGQCRARWPAGARGPQRASRNIECGDATRCRHGPIGGPNCPRHLSASWDSDPLERDPCGFATHASSAPAISARRTPRAWPSSATRSSASTSTSQDRPARRRRGPVLRARAARAARPSSVASGRLRFTTSYAEVGRVRRRALRLRRHPAEEGRVRRRPDLRRRGRRRASAPLLTRGALVVGKSTVPAGTAAPAGRIAIARRRAPRLAWNPEFLREGFAVEDTLRPDRLVIGVESPSAARQVLREVYAPSARHAACRWSSPTSPPPSWSRSPPTRSWPPRSRSSTRWPRSARRPGADVTQLAEALAHDARIGGRFLHAGLGFGGGCLPKDIRAFMARAGELGVDQALSFLREVDAINLRRRARMVDLARELCGGTLAGVRVGVLGAAFKPNSDDIRDSPALDVAATRSSGRRAVRVYRPAGDGQRQAMLPAAELRRDRPSRPAPAPTSCCT